VFRLVDAAVAALALVSPCVAYRHEARTALAAARDAVEQSGHWMHMSRSDLPSMVDAYRDLWVMMEAEAESARFARLDAEAATTIETDIAEWLAGLGGDELPPGASRQRRRGVGQ
jgi:hypothetical protein